jgi:hypothetical protein
LKERLIGSVFNFRSIAISDGLRPEWVATDSNPVCSAQIAYNPKYKIRVESGTEALFCRVVLHDDASVFYL